MHSYLVLGLAFEHISLHNFMERVPGAHKYYLIILL